MVTKNVKLCGVEVVLAYCYATEIAFRKYTGVNVEDIDPKNPEHSIYLIISAMLPYYEQQNQKPPISDSDLMYKSEPNDYFVAFKAILEARNEWYKVPEGEPKDKPAEEDPKNAQTPATHSS